MRNQGMIGNVRLHHVGMVVASISAAAPSFASLFAAKWNRVVIHDPIQRAHVTFLSTSKDDPLIELVEFDPVEAPEASVSERNNLGSIHHLCYEVDDISVHLERIRAARGLIVRDPAPAAAFEGRHIVWAYTKERVLVEYLEA